MVIKVIGMGCENCDKLYENVMEAVKAVSYTHLTLPTTSRV